MDFAGDDNVRVLEDDDEDTRFDNMLNLNGRN